MVTPQVHGGRRPCPAPAAPARRPVLPVGTPRFSCLALLLAAACLLACSPEVDDTAREPGTIRFWQFWRPEIIQPIIDQFEYEFPELRVDVRQLEWSSGLLVLEAAIADGSAPDLCELTSTWLSRLAAAGALREVTDAARPLTPDLHLWETVTVGEAVYGFPWLASTRALFWNRELFRQARLDSDRPPETWDELLRAAAAIDSLGPDIYGFGINAEEPYILYRKFMPFARANGAAVLTADRRDVLVDAPAMVEALEFYTRLAGRAMREPQLALDDAFRGGHLAMQISGAWELRAITEGAPELDFEVAPVPRPDLFTGEHGSVTSSEVLVVIERPDASDAAIELARFLVQRANAIRLCRAVGHVQPAARGAATDPYYATHPRERLFVEQLELAATPIAHPAWPRLEEILSGAVDAALHSVGPVDTLLAAAARSMERVLVDHAEAADGLPRN